MAVTITRDQLAKFLPDNDTIRRFEKLFLQVAATDPENIDVIFRLIEEVVVGAGSAVANSNQANASLESIAQSLALLAAGPPVHDLVIADNLSPPIQIGTMGEQQSDRVRITGGAIDGTVIGANTPAAVTGTTLTSTAATTVGTLLDISAAAAGQIKFPAAQNPSANANTLDDYEEVTPWTPVVTFATPGDLAVVYSLQSGGATKIGRQVFANYLISTSTFTHTTASGDLILTGLPFTSGVPIAISGQVDWGGITKADYTQINGALLSGSSQIIFVANGSGLVRSTVTTVNVPTGSSLFLSGTISYFV